MGRPEDKTENPQPPIYPNLKGFTLNDFQLLSSPDGQTFVQVAIRPDAAEYIRLLAQASRFLDFEGIQESPTDEALSNRVHSLEKQSRFVDWTIREIAEQANLSEEEEIEIRKSPDVSEALEFTPLPADESIKETKQRVRRQALKDYSLGAGILMGIQGIIQSGFFTALGKEASKVLRKNPDLFRISSLTNSYEGQGPRFVVIDERNGETIFKTPPDLTVEYTDQS